MTTDHLHLKVIEVNYSDAEPDYLIADHDTPAKDVLIGAGAVYCQVADRLTAEIFVRSVNSHAGLLAALIACKHGAEYCDELGDIIDAAISKASSPALQAGEQLISTAPDLLDALRLILPLAKGYAAAHPVGSNAAYIAHAEDSLAKAEGSALQASGGEKP